MLPKQIKKITAQFTEAGAPFNSPFLGIVSLRKEGKTENFQFEPVPHVQQPMIEATVRYLLGNAANPSSAEEGLIIMRLMDTFSK